MLAGVSALISGILIIIELKLHPLWRCVAGVIWILDCHLELRRISAGSSWLRQLTLDSAGGVMALDAAGDNVSLTLRSGSIVLPELAWLRVADDEGRMFTGLFARRRTDSPQWHRLQLLWHQSRGAFGHRAGP
jgi:hypothetical protein